MDIDLRNDRTAGFVSYMGQNIARMHEATERARQHIEAGHYFEAFMAIDDMENLLYQTHRMIGINRDLRGEFFAERYPGTAVR